jgi:hypothetical protein
VPFKMSCKIYFADWKIEKPSVHVTMDVIGLVFVSDVGNKINFLT